MQEYQNTILFNNENKILGTILFMNFCFTKTIKKRTPNILKNRTRKWQSAKVWVSKKRKGMGGRR